MTKFWNCQNHSFGRKYRKGPKNGQILKVANFSKKTKFIFWWPNTPKGANFPNFSATQWPVWQPWDREWRHSCGKTYPSKPGWWLNRNENMHFLCWLSTIFEAIPPRLCSIFTYFALNMNENGISNMKTGPLWVEYVFFKHFLG